MGKGSAPRTFDIDQETFAGNWAKTFGKQNAKQKQEDTDKENLNEQQPDKEGTKPSGQS
jgi:hypothetical protein